MSEIKIKETILTPEEWRESKLLYGQVINPNARYFINRSVYINRPPSSCPVLINPNTGNYHVLSIIKQGK